MNRQTISLGRILGILVDLECYQRRLDEGERHLAAQKEEFRQKGIEVEIRVGDGPTVATIIDVAEHIEADLIAMASHGRTGLARCVLWQCVRGRVAPDRPAFVADPIFRREQLVSLLRSKTLAAKSSS